MPKKKMPYPTTEPFSLNVGGRVVVFTQMHFQKIFRKTMFVEKVKAFKTKENIGNLRTILSVFQCTSDQLSRVLQGTNKVALHAASALATNAVFLKSKGFKIRSLSSMLNGTGSSVFFAINAITKDVQRLLDLKYTPVNISSMLNGAGRSTPIVIEAIAANTGALKALGYTLANISSMLNGAGSSAPMVTRAILKNTDMLKALGYTNANISSMLRGAKSSIPIVIQAILKNTNVLKALGYTKTNISSMLTGSYIPIVIIAIIENTNALKALGYTQANISSILNGAGRSTPLVIRTIFENTDALKDLGYTLANISSMLNSACSSAPVAISAIAANTQSLLDLGFSNHNISGYLYDKSFDSYTRELQGIIELSSKVLRAGYLHSQLRQLLHDRAPSCQGAIILMKSILRTHEAFSEFPTQTPGYLVGLAIAKSFDKEFFADHLEAIQAMHQASQRCQQMPHSASLTSARQSRGGSPYTSRLLLKRSPAADAGILMAP